jgi:xanthine dehydrogenase molybdopterin-binding subunit B
MCRSQPANDGIEDYFIWGCCVSEVEVDLLTGEKKVQEKT